VAWFTVRHIFPPDTMMNRNLHIGCGILFGIYFPLGYYFSTTYQNDIPKRDDLAVILIIGTTSQQGIVYSKLWLPTDVSKATVYRDGAMLGEATAIYPDPNNTYVSWGTAPDVHRI
jgi:hypothetical protein